MKGLMKIRSASWCLVVAVEFCCCVRHGCKKADGFADHKAAAGFGATAAVDPVDRWGRFVPGVLRVVPREKWQREGTRCASVESDGAGPDGDCKKQWWEVSGGAGAEDHRGRGDDRVAWVAGDAGVGADFSPGGGGRGPRAGEAGEFGEIFGVDPEFYSLSIDGARRNIGIN